MFFIWNFTVSRLMPIMEDISHVLFPSLTQSNISFSRDVRETARFFLAPAPDSWLYLRRRCGPICLKMTVARGVRPRALPSNGNRMSSRWVIRHISPAARRGIDVDHGFYVFDDPLEFLFGRAEKARMDYLQEAQRVLLRKGCVRCR